MTPLDPQQAGELQSAVPPPLPGPSEANPTAPRVSWFSRFTSVVFVIFCFEIGLFLLIYPWTDAWTDNTISLLGRGEYQLPFRELWNNPYFRGAVSGLGILNFWIALAELFSLFRGPAETKASV